MSINLNGTVGFSLLLPEFTDLWALLSLLILVPLIDLTTSWSGLSLDWWSIDSDIWASYIDILPRYGAISHVLIRVAVLTTVVKVIAFVVPVCFWTENCLMHCVICLVKAFEYDVGISIFDKLFVDVLQKLTWLRFHDADVVHSTAADLDNLSVHERLD